MMNYIFKVETEAKIKSSSVSGQASGDFFFYDVVGLYDLQFLFVLQLRY